MKAIILAGGEGTRLRPLTSGLAKPAVPVMNKPVIIHIIELLKKHGISNIAVTLKYLPLTVKETVNRYFPENKIEFFVENIPLGTAGSVKNCQNFIDEDFLVISGDAMTDVDLSKAIDFHREKNSKITIISKKVQYPSQYGVIIADKENSVIGFREKPSANETEETLVNTGMYIVSPEIMEYCEENKAVDFAKDIFPKLLKNNIKIYSYETKDYWCDVGDTKAYLEANIQLLEQTKERAFVGKNCKVDSTASIKNSIIGDNCVIQEGTMIENSVIWNNTIVEKGTKITGSILCNNVTVMEGSECNEAIIGAHTTLENNVFVKKHTSIWPEIIVLKESIVSGVIKDSFDSKMPVYENDGISAVGNYSPEFTVKIGAAFGTFLGVYTSCLVGHDKDGAASMIASGIKTGLSATSVQVKQCVNSLPVLRWMIRSGLADGGVYVTGGKNSRVKFLDNKGNDLWKNDRKKLLSIYRMGDYSYAPKSAISSEEIMSDAEDFYTSELMKIFKCPHKNLNYLGRHFTQSQKQAIIAYLTVKLYPQAPLFSQAKSMLTVEYISKKYDRYLVKCGNNSGDIMMEMEKLMHIPGVYAQYLMMTDELAFDLAICCLEAEIMKENDHIYDITQLSPPVYSLSQSTINTSNTAEIIKTVKEKYHGEILDGVSAKQNDANIHVTCDDSGHLFNVYVESFSEEYAKEIMDDVMQVVKRKTL